MPIGEDSDTALDNVNNWKAGLDLLLKILEGEFCDAPVENTPNEAVQSDKLVAQCPARDLDLFACRRTGADHPGRSSRTDRVQHERPASITSADPYPVARQS